MLSRSSCRKLLQHPEDLVEAIVIPVRVGDVAVAAGVDVVEDHFYFALLLTVIREAEDILVVGAVHGEDEVVFFQALYGRICRALPGYIQAVLLAVLTDRGRVVRRCARSRCRRSPPSSRYSVRGVCFQNTFCQGTGRCYPGKPLVFSWNLQFEIGYLSKKSDALFNENTSRLCLRITTGICFKPWRFCCQENQEQ